MLEKNEMLYKCSVMEHTADKPIMEAVLVLETAAKWEPSRPEELCEVLQDTEKTLQLISV